MQDISHPNIVQILGYCCEGEVACIIYEYMRGGSFEERLADMDIVFRLHCLVDIAKGIRTKVLSSVKSCYFVN